MRKQFVIVCSLFPPKCNQDMWNISDIDTLGMGVLVCYIVRINHFGSLLAEYITAI